MAVVSLFAFTTVAITATVAILAVPFPTAIFDQRPDLSTHVLDRRGEVMLDIPSARGTRSTWVGLDAISPHVRHAFMAAEDKRFDDHMGVDCIAMGRAAFGHIIGTTSSGGASTLTQQLVKTTLMRGASRTVGTKLEEIVWAIRLEAALSKERILEEYLNRIDFGNNLVGIEAAAKGYFGLPAARLAPSQAALLAALPNAPHDLNPRKHSERALVRARAILGRMRDLGLVDGDTFAIAIKEPLRLQPSREPLAAAWLTTRVKEDIATAAPRPLQVKTTIDGRLQRSLEDLITTPQHPQAQGMPLATSGRHQAAIAVLDTRSGEVLAWVGSRDWHDLDGLGRTDAVTALRQPGSALKPFIYAMLLEDGATDQTLLADAPYGFETPKGVYRPQNFDRKFRGQVSLREALGSSLNLPAVHTAVDLGIDRVLRQLRALGLDSLTHDADHYGPGLALGNGEVRLIDLAQAYATLGRLGVPRATRWIVNTEAGEADETSERPVIDRQAALTILDILADDRARGIGFGHASALNLPFRVAMKTGTSSDRRDNWAFGVTPDFTVGVWVGHFDGRAVNTADAHLAAAPILRGVFQHLYPRAARPGDVPWFPAPSPSDDRTATR